MKIILQHTLTLSFYGKDRRWTQNVSEAENFENCLQALTKSQENDFRNVAIIVDFEDGRDSLDLPIN